MGTFIHIVDKSRGIPKEKQEEFKERLITLFRQGGMMEQQIQSLFGKKIITINPVKYDKYQNIDFIYNYFEDSLWENSGFNGKTGHVYSRKVGWSFFNFVMASAYVLESLYSDGDFVILENGDPLINEERDYIAWINSLFNENYAWKNWDFIKVWNLIKSDENDYDTYLKRYRGFGYEYDPFVPWLEMRALKYGINNMREDVDEENQKFVDRLIFFSQKNKEAVQSFKDNSTETEKQQIQRLIHMINHFINHHDEDYPKEKSLFHFVVSLIWMNSPHLALLSISEVYGIDFFEIYQLLDHYDSVIISGMKDMMCSVSARELSDFFDIYPENMIYFWKESQFQQIPSYLHNWFLQLKEMYNHYMQNSIDIENPLSWIMDMLVYAENNYYQIYVFSDFFEESIENINDQRYLILWKIFEDMIYNEKFYKIGEVIFESENKEYLNNDWTLMSKDKKWNSARLKLRGYLGLIANKELRRKVFGF